MKFEIKRDVLLKSLNFVQGVVEKKNTNKGFELKNEAMLESGIMINSDFLNGLDSERAKKEVLSRLEDEGVGNKKINYKLRDWGVSRQRYWGCPIPMIYREDGEVVPVEEKDLPVLLPMLQKNKPNPTKEEVDQWKNTICPQTGMKAVRETDTFDTF